MHAHSRTHIENAQTRTRHLHVCACDLAGKHIRTCERTHIYASILTYWQPIDNLHIQAHARTHAGSGAGTRTHECARAQHVQTRACACASTRVCVDTAATLRAAAHWKVRPFPIPSKLQVPRLADRTRVSSLPESIGNCRKLQSLCAAPAPAYHAWCCRRARACSPLHVVMHVSTGLL
jgi:hypothetical protein